MPRPTLSTAGRSVAPTPHRPLIQLGFLGQSLATPRFWAESAWGEGRERPWRYSVRWYRGFLQYGLLGAAGAVASILSCAYFIWPQFGGSDVAHPPALSIDPPAFPTLALTPAPTVFVPPSPASAPRLEEMLKAGLSVPSSAGQRNALKIVAEEAIRRGDYRIAIKAGAGTPSSSGRSETLSYVAICAAKEGLFKIAAEAAGAIPSSSVRSSTTITILEIESRLGGNSDEQPASPEEGTTGQRPVVTDCR